MKGCNHTGGIVSQLNGHNKEQIKFMSIEYRIVINHEEQYSLIPIDQPLKRGWKDTGKMGSDTECLKHIEEVWTDMAPADLERIKASLRH